MPDQSESNGSTSSDPNEPGHASILRKHRRQDNRRVSKGHSLTGAFQNYSRTKTATIGKPVEDIMAKKGTFNLSIASEDYESDYDQSFYEDEADDTPETRLRNPAHVLQKKDKKVRRPSTFAQQQHKLKRTKTMDMQTKTSTLIFRKRDSFLVKKEMGDLSDTSSDEGSPKR